MAKTPSYEELLSVKDKILERLAPLTFNEHGCLLWPKQNKNKWVYPYMNFSVNECGDRLSPRRVIISRAIYSLKHGPIDKDMIIRHTCDNYMCVNVEHLIVGTHQDNVKDKVERGRCAVGTKNGRSKLTEQNVLEIKELVKTNTTISEIARQFSVDRKVIRDIRDNKTWRTVTSS